MSDPVEILTSPGLTITNVHCTWTDDIRIIPMPVEEMCLEDLPTIEIDLRKDT